MVRSFLPKFSSKSEKRLLCLCKNNPNKDTDIEKWNKNAVQYIVKSLKKNLDSLDELERSISQECSDTKCILLPKIPDNNNRLLIAHRRGLPQVIYCRLWRWPDLQSHHQIRPIDKCISRSESIPTPSGIVGSSDVKTVCVNPYHYERKKPLPLEPVYVPCSRIPPDLSTSYEDSEPTGGGGGCGGGTRAITVGMLPQHQQAHHLNHQQHQQRLANQNMNTSTANATVVVSSNLPATGSPVTTASAAGSLVASSSVSVSVNRGAYINTSTSTSNSSASSAASQQQQQQQQQNQPPNQTTPATTTTTTTMAVHGQENIKAEQLCQQQQQQQPTQPPQPQPDNDDTVDFFSGLRPEQIPDVYYTMPAEESQQQQQQPQQPSLVLSQNVSENSQQQPMHVQSQVQMPYHQSQAQQQSQQPMQTQQTPCTQYQQSVHYQQHQPSQQQSTQHIQLQPHQQHQTMQQQQLSQQQHHHQQQQQQQQTMPPQTVRTGQLQQHITTRTEIAHPYQFKQNTFARQHLSMHDPDPVVGQQQQQQQNYNPQSAYGPGSTNTSYYQPQQQQHVQYQQAPYSHQSGPLQPVQQMTSYGPPVYQADYQMQQYQPQSSAQQQMQSEQMQLDHPMGQCQTGPCQSQQLIGSQILLAEIKYMEQSNWCSVFYNEYNIRVGERYQPRSPVVYIDGYTHPACADRYCVGGLSNVQRNEFTEWVRRRIGRGIKLSSVDGEVFVECLSESSIFVCAPIMHAEEEGAQAMERVIKVPHGSSMKVFSVHLFSRFLSTSIDMGFEACYKLTNFATFRISFVKGWGKNYKRQKVPETPCWLEIQLNAPLSWLDRVLRTMKPPQGCGSTS